MQSTATHRAVIRLAAGTGGPALMELCPARVASATPPGIDVIASQVA